jgi:hypothetical protein
MAKKKRSGSTARDFLQRSETHVIDGKARQHFTTNVPAEWVVNALSEGDYGKDYHIEPTGASGRVRIPPMPGSNQNSNSRTTRRTSFDGVLDSLTCRAGS